MSCIQLFQPICAIMETGLPVEYSNSCMAGCVKGIITSFDGSCASLLKNCSNLPIPDCTSPPITGEYCAFSDNVAPSTVTSNRCCGSPYKAFLNGACPTRSGTPPPPPPPPPPPVNTSIPCLKTSKSLNCLRKPRDQVCGNVGRNQRTYKNSC
jgi:hypothetical protein